MATVVSSSCRPQEERDVSDVVRIMTGEMLTYDFLIHSSNGAEIQAMQTIANKHRTKVNLCMRTPVSILYFLVFACIVFFHLDVTNCYLIESQLRGTADGIFEEVDDIDALWEAINGDLVDSFFFQTERWGDTIPKGDGESDKWGMWGRVGLYNKLQGAIRFDQSRKTRNSFGLPSNCNNDPACDLLCQSNTGFQEVGCNVMSPVGSRCPSSESIRASCGLRRLNASEQESEQPQKKRRLSLSWPPLEVMMPQKPTSNDEDVFRFYIYPSETKDDINKRLAYFHNRRWLDSDTETLSIRLYLLNGEFGQPIMEQLTMNFFMANGGNIYYSREVQAIFFDIFPGMITMGMDGIWFLLLLFSSLVQVVALFGAYRGAGFCSYVKDGKNILEIIVVLIGWVVAYQFFSVMLTKFTMVDTMTDLRKYGWELGEAQQSAVDKLFEEAGGAASQMDFLTKVFANYTLLCMARFLVTFNAQPMLSIITRTLSHLVTDLVHFLVIFVPCFLVYVASGTLMFGRRMEDFATFGASLGSTFRMAQEGEYDWAGFKKEYYYSSAIWIWTFILFINILFINLVLAIVLDNYNEVRSSEKTNEPVWETLTQFWYRTIHLTSWVRERQIDAKFSEPDHEDVVTREQFEAYFPGMPSYQMDLLFRDSNQAMGIMSEKDLDATNLLKLSRSMMEDIGTVNGSLRSIVDEETQDSLQSWVVPKKENIELDAGGGVETFTMPPVTTKGNKPARLTPPEEAKPFDVESMKWAPGWMREVGGMLKTQRQWLAHATWQLEQLQWNMQNAAVSKLQEEKQEPAN